MSKQSRNAPIARGASTHALLLAAGVVIVALLAVFALDRCSYPTSHKPRHVAASATPLSGLPTVPASELPPDALAMIATIDHGGPYGYPQDGQVFGNNEGLLPRRPHGYYREYTVVAAPSPDRGARRLVVGQLGDIYYTDDHYRSFRQVIR